MKVVIDTNTLIRLLDPRTEKGIRVRLDGLLESVQKTRGAVIVPAQVLAEYLVDAGSAGDQIIKRFVSNQYLVVAGFDHKAAVECAELDMQARARGTKRWPLPKDRPWQKVKVDRQIVAIAKAHNAGMLVSEDSDLLNIAAAAHLTAQRPSDLPIPDSAKQMHIEDLAPSKPTGFGLSVPESPGS